MKKYFIFFLIFFLIHILTQAQDGGNYCSEGKISSFSRLSKLSSVQYPGDSNIDVTYYKLDLRVYINPNSLSGIVTVKAKAASQNLTTFYLDLVNALAVSSVKLNGTSLTFSQANNQLTINLDRPYNLNEEFSVEISYSGIPTSGTGSISNASFLFTDKNLSNKVVVASLSEPYGARDWWPSKDTPADKVDSSDVWITADQFFVSVSNGSLGSIVDNPDGTRTYKWKNHYPLANYLISIAMTNYQTVVDQFEYQSGKFLPVVHYCYPERLDNTRRTAVAKTIDMLRIYSEKFGPYPYLKEKYGHAEFSWGGGMEHQTVTSMGGGAMSSENTIAHELAHQWFGDKVTCKDWQNIWLNEGFASYCECIYREAKYGNADFKSYVDNFMNNTNNGAKKAVGSIYVQNISSENEIFNTARSYRKGAIVLHMLRGIVGDDKFFQILKEYLIEPGLSYNVATTEDFQRIAERVSGMNLNYFFQEWIYGENYPKYTVEWNYEKTNGNNYNLVVRITQNVNSNPSFFTMPIQLTVNTENGVENFSIVNNLQTQVFQLPLNGKPISIQVDPNNWLLKNILALNFEPSLVITPSSFYLFQNYPNPFNPSTVISYRLSVIGKVSLKIYDLLGKEVATLVNKEQQPGVYNSQFSISNFQLPSGVYFYTLKAGEFIETKKMILLK